MNIFSGVTWDWGFTATDILTNAMVLFGGLSLFILLGLSFYFAPKIIQLIKTAAS
jgi:hypothetical protein